jgi:hypothetical protein
MYIPLPDIDYDDTSAIRAFIEQWHRTHLDKKMPIGWPMSWHDYRARMIECEHHIQTAIVAVRKETE